MTIAELLQQSRDAHQRYRVNVPRRVSDGGASTVAVPGNALEAGAALLEACRLRAEAGALDPQRTDPAWADEPLTHDHDDLLTFYAEQLAR